MLKCQKIKYINGKYYMYNPYYNLTDPFVLTDEEIENVKNCDPENVQILKTAKECPGYWISGTKD